VKCDASLVAFWIDVSELDVSMGFVIFGLSFGLVDHHVVTPFAAAKADVIADKWC
jgi:hypothetical protein